MSLVKPAEMTEANRAAHRRNGSQSRGPATPQGKERSRAGNLRHGMYSQDRDEALTALGEDPAVLAELIAGSYEQWRPVNASQAQMVERLARLQWRMDRAERLQDDLAAEQVRQVAAARQKQARQHRERHVEMRDTLWCLQGHVRRPDFYASPGYLQSFQQAFEGETDPLTAAMWEALQRLQKPRRLPAVEGPLAPEATSDEEWRTVLEAMEEEAEGFVPPDDLPVAEEAAERAELREFLRSSAQAQEATLQTAWRPLFDEYMKPLTTAERAQAATDEALTSQLDRLRREEESCTRQFWRLSNLLVKLQDRAAEDESEDRGPKSQVGAGDESEVPGPKSQVDRQSATGVSPVPEHGRDGHGTENTHKNAGATGDVEENKGRAKWDVATNRPTQAADRQERVAPLNAQPANVKSMPSPATVETAVKAGKAAA